MEERFMRRSICATSTDVKGPGMDRDRRATSLSDELEHLAEANGIDRQ